MDQEWEVVCYSQCGSPKVRVYVVLAYDASAAITAAGNQGAPWCDIVCVRLRGLL